MRLISAADPHAFAPHAVASGGHLRRRRPANRGLLRKAVLSAGVATTVAVTATSGAAGAHTRDTGYLTVVNLPASVGCIDVRSELKHDGNKIRVWGKVRSRKGAHLPSGAWSCSGGGKQPLKLRLKLQVMHRSPSGSTFSACLSTAGDGRGPKGYVHSEGSGWEMGRYMRHQGQEYFTYPCGRGSYRARTWGHAYNDGWRGTNVDTPAESFPVK